MLYDDLHCGIHSDQDKNQKESLQVSIESLCSSSYINEYRGYKYRILLYVNILVNSRAPFAELETSKNRAVVLLPLHVHHKCDKMNP